MIQVVRVINGFFTWVFDLLLAPFASVPALGMIFISALTAVWALLLFKAVTQQDKLTHTRDQLFGHIYEMGLYQDHLGILARIQGDLAKTNFRYLFLTLPALVALTLPMIFTLGQLEGRFGYRPLKVGEEVVVTVQADDDTETSVQDLDVRLPAGLVVKAGPVRNQRKRTVSWRFGILDAGEYELEFYQGKKLMGQAKLNAERRLSGLHRETQDSLLGVMLYPASPDLRNSVGLVGLAIQWPVREVRYLGFELNWLVAFMAFSMVTGLLVKDVLKVSV